MTPVIIERVLPAPLEKVFAFVTQQEYLSRWWGHGDIATTNENADFTKLGSWFVEMHDSQGKRYKISGQVTKVQAPNLVAFTWGWHDDTDQRGEESHVMIELEAIDDDKTRLVLNHRGLSTPGARQGHTAGWTSFLQKLEDGLA